MEERDINAKLAHFFQCLEEGVKEKGVAIGKVCGEDIEIRVDARIKGWEC